MDQIVRPEVLEGSLHAIKLCPVCFAPDLNEDVDPSTIRDLPGTVEKTVRKGGVKVSTFA